MAAIAPARHRLQRGHGIARGMQFCAYPGLHGRDFLAVGDRYTINGTVNERRMSDGGPCLQVAGASYTSGVSWPRNGLVHRLGDNRQQTFVVWGKVTGNRQNGNSANAGLTDIFTIDSASGHTSPYEMGLLIGGSANSPANSLIYQYPGATSGFLRASAGASSYVMGSERIGLMAVVRSSAVAVFYKAGLRIASVAITDEAVHSTWSAGAGLVTLGNLADGGWQNQSSGDFVMAACWNRALNDAEIARLHVDPYLLIRPTLRPALVSSGPPMAIIAAYYNDQEAA